MSARCLACGGECRSEWRTSLRPIYVCRSCGREHAHVDRKARDYGIGSPVRDAVWTRDRARCRYCGGEADHLDHVVPLAHGGLATEDNLVCACQSCGIRKADRTPGEAGMPLREPPP